MRQTAAVAAGAVSVDTRPDAVVLTVKGTLDDTTGELLQEAIAASGSVDESRRVIVDVSRAGVVTAEGRQSLVGCVRVAAWADVALRFRFGLREDAGT